MRKNYFDSISNVYGWMEENPKKREVIGNAKIDGVVKILSDSCNRAITIETEENIFLQSYDTVVCSIDKATGEIKKLWDGYSKTTLKHINTFLGTNMNKKAWETL